MIIRLAAALTLLLAFAHPAWAQLDRNSHLSMMRHTVVIRDPAGPAKTFAGAGFVMGRPFQNDARRFLSILVTANSVLESIPGRVANFTLRYETNATWAEIEMQTPIRNADGGKLWTAHANADVAALVAPVFFDAFPARTLINTSRLLTDEGIRQYGVGPGDDIACLWFPLGLENPSRFPFLRLGRIASFPLSPMKEVGAWAADFNGFKGNFGSPIYLVKQEPVESGSRRSTTPLFAVAGLAGRTNPAFGAEDTAAIQKDSGLCFVVPASFIREVVEKVPDPTASDLVPFTPAIP